jgi:flagellar basal-body rod protein FlgB
MPEDMLSDVTVAALVKTLDCAAMRHRALANNIANAETPGFTRSDVEFQERLDAAVERARALGSPQPIEEVQPSLVVDRESPARADGNNVDIEREMAALTRNHLEYESAAQALALKLAMLRTAVNEGRR